MFSIQLFKDARYFQIIFQSILYAMAFTFYTGMVNTGALALILAQVLPFSLQVNFFWEKRSFHFSAVKKRNSLSTYFILWAKPIA